MLRARGEGEELIPKLAGVIGAILRHRENITRLLNGTENKFARKLPTSP